MAMSKGLINEVQEKIIKKVDILLSDEKIDSSNFFFKEGDFATELEVSRSTVREAVRSLEVRGYLERVHGRGVRAIDRSVQVVSHSITDMLNRNSVTSDNILEVRRIIEIQIAGLAAERATSEDKKKLKKYIDIMKDTSISYEEYLNADLEFHTQLTHSSKNPMLIAIVTAYQNIIKDVVIASTDEDYRPELDMHYHEKIYVNIVDKDSEGAMKSMKEHLDGTETNIEKLHKK